MKLLTASRVSAITVLLFCSLVFLSFAQPTSTDGELQLAAGRISPILAQDIGLWSGPADSTEKIPVIVQVEPDQFDRLSRMRGDGLAANSLPLVNAYTARLTAAQIRSLLRSKRVEYVTLDAPIRSTFDDDDDDDDEGGSGPSSFLKAIGADKAWDLGYDGSGVVAAIFDSGMNGSNDYANRVIKRVKFTSGVPEAVGWRKRDPYGHGTHVGGIIAGNGNRSRGSYGGVAPGIELLSIQVVDESGSGLTSNLIKAIDWLIEHKDAYGVRVANLSLGHPPLESYLQDPLCQAVERLVEAGIVTVVSAGNLGKTDRYPKIYGAITSPGNDPAVITVGPVNSRGTATHSDDIATSYGSRGPTYLDGLFKPDLVAPGNKIPGSRAKGSWIDTHHPELRIRGGDDDDDDDDESHYLRLSGSSMATAFVSGTAALMLQANPDLTPHQVKAILMLTASKLTWPKMLEQGNGMVNALTAVRIAEAADTVTQSLTRPVPLNWQSGTERVWAGGAMAVADRILYTGLVDINQAVAWGSGLDWSQLLLPVDSRAWSDGLFAPDSVFWTDGIFFTDSTLWTDSVFWTDNVLADSVFWTDSVMWSNVPLDSDSVFWTDSLFWTDTNLTSGTSALVGDE